ncbi:hypothetical protein PVAP13_5NG159681 [Panicum virgatum]|uniref:Uncharacterized protein n=1 Tax=Panicum virgatum TaxID=38727 RepID=A0A8T0RMU8_PANVG|nr:hypothetical protein PVAP13_5NG159681 [Panicum virgatum]
MGLVVQCGRFTSIKASCRQAGALFLSVSLPLAALNLEQGSRVMASTTSGAKENSKLRDSISDTRAQIDSMLVPRANWKRWLFREERKMTKLIDEREKEKIVVKSTEDVAEF